MLGAEDTTGNQTEPLTTWSLPSSEEEGSKQTRVFIYVSVRYGNGSMVVPKVKGRRARYPMYPRRPLWSSDTGGQRVYQGKNVPGIVHSKCRSPEQGRGRRPWWPELNKRGDEVRRAVRAKRPSRAIEICLESDGKRGNVMSEE